MLGKDLSGQDAIEMLIGAVCVAASAASRFRRPSDADKSGLAALYDREAAQTSTTRGRYTAALAGYTACILGVYYLMVFDEHWLRAVASSAEKEREDLAPWAFSVPITGALLLSVLAPITPPFSHADRALRGFFQRLASIPVGVLRLTRFLQHHVKLQGAAGDAPSPASRALGQVEALIRHSEEWSGNPTFEDYQARFADVHASLKTRLAESRTITEALAQGQGAPGEPALGRRLVDEQVRRLREDVLEYIARGILRSCTTKKQRVQALTKLGIEEEVGRSMAPAITLFFVGAWAAVILGFLFLRPLFGAVEGAQVVTRSAQIATYVCAAIFCAVFLRPRAPIPSDRRVLQRPFHLYFLAGGASALVCLTFAVLFKLAKYGDYSDVLADLRYRWPWQILTLGMGACVAFYVDTSFRQRSRSASVLGAAAVAAAFAGCGVLTVRVLEEMQRPLLAAPPGARPAAILAMLDPLPSLAGIAGLCSIVGLAVALVLPAFIERQRLADVKLSADLLGTLNYDAEKRAFGPRELGLLPQDFVPFAIDRGSRVAGKSLSELDLRRRTGATVVALARADKTLTLPEGSEAVLEGDVLALAGSNDAIAAARRMLASA
jgi:hypothetical protein